MMEVGSLMEQWNILLNNSGQAAIRKYSKYLDTSSRIEFIQYLERLSDDKSTPIFISDPSSQLKNLHLGH